MPGYKRPKKGDPVTPLEYAVLDSLAKGRTGPEIAAVLSYSYGVIRNAMVTAKVKLGANTLYEAVAIRAVMRERKSRWKA